MKRHHLYLGIASVASALLGLWLASASSAPDPELKAPSFRSVSRQLASSHPNAHAAQRRSEPPKPESTIGRPLRRGASTPQQSAEPPIASAPLRRQSRGPEGHKALDEVKSLAMTLRRYGQRFGGNPVGTNAEITRELNGGNSAQARLLTEADKPRLNAKGELLDPWGTPYFFHQVSAAKTEVISAGTDRRLHTHDDLKH